MALQKIKVKDIDTGKMIDLMVDINYFFWLCEELNLHRKGEMFYSENDGVIWEVFSPINDRFFNLSLPWSTINLKKTSLEIRELWKGELGYKVRIFLSMDKSARALVSFTKAIQSLEPSSKLTVGEIALAITQQNLDKLKKLQKEGTGLFS